jgi:hypothetical protein
MYSKKAAYLLVMLFIQITGLSAQSIKINMSGRIIDNDSVPIVGASVLLLNSVDSAYIAGTASDLDGLFELSCFNPDEYILSFSMIGYKKIAILKQIAHEADIAIGDVILEENAYLLSGVTVTGQRSPFKIESGKTVVNLSSALLSAEGNILDVLRKLPGVIIQNDGTIILNGKSGANVLIDDKVTYLSGENLINYLRSIPAKSIENIELISQQSSKYDAAGNSGIINIQKKRIVEEGVNISASSGMESGKYNRWSETVSLAIRLNRLNIYADYSAYWGKDLTHVFASRTYLNVNPPLLLEMDATRKMRYRSQYIKTGIDYDLSEKITVGTYLSSNWLNRKKNEISISDFYNNDRMLSDSTVTAPSTTDYSYTNIRGGADISYKWSGEGKWDASFDYQLFDQGDNQILAPSSLDRIERLEKDTLSGKTNGDIKLYSGQTNLNYALNNRIKITAGLKTVLVSINSDAIYKNRIKGSWVNDNSLSSRFNYKENINAAYIQLNSEWFPRFSSEIGLRLENTNVESQFTTSKSDSVFNQNYTHIFPAVIGQYRFSENHSFSITYSRRIVRPNYRDMNPFTEVRDQYLHEKGNTELKPELTDNIEFLWLLKKRFAFNLFYSFRNNPIAKSYLTEDNRTLVIPLNLSGNHSAGLKIGLNNIKPFTWWTMHINSSLTFKQFDWIISGEAYKNEHITPMVHVNNQLSLPLGWKMEVIGYYNGYMAEGQAKVHPIGSVSLGVRKSLFNDKLGLYIYANDIFKSNRPFIELQNNTMKGWYKERYDSRMVGITLSYRFNWGKETKKSQTETKIEESKRITL